MIMTRRTFLATMLAACAAPAIVRASSLMPVRDINKVALQHARDMEFAFFFPTIKILYNNYNTDTAKILLDRGFKKEVYTMTGLQLLYWKYEQNNSIEYLESCIQDTRYNEFDSTPNL